MVHKPHVFDSRPTEDAGAKKEVRKGFDQPVPDLAELRVVELEVAAIVVGDLRTDMVDFSKGWTDGVVDHKPDDEVFVFAAPVAGREWTEK